jgi:hypothetical protein
VRERAPEMTPIRKIATAIVRPIQKTSGMSGGDTIEPSRRRAQEAPDEAPARAPSEAGGHCRGIGTAVAAEIARLGA